MRNEQTPVHEIDIRLDTSESVLEGIVQRPSMLIVVMGMSHREEHLKEGEHWCSIV